MRVKDSERTHGEEEEEEEEGEMTTKKSDPTVAKLSITGCMLKTKKKRKGREGSEKTPNVHT